MPWYGYARQDKKSAPREPISARIVAKCLEAVGVDRVLTMDLHAGQVQGFFHVPVDHMTAMPMLTQWFIDQEHDGRAGDRLPRRRPGEDGAQLRPPDRHPLGGDGEGAPGPAGGRDRLRGRRRQGQDRGPGRRHDRHRRHPLRRRPDRARRGRRPGHRLRHPRRLLRPPAYERLADSAIERIVVTDTLPLRPGAPDNITVLSTASTFADSIRRIFTDDSVSRDLRRREPALLRGSGALDVRSAGGVAASPKLRLVGHKGADLSCREHAGELSGRGPVAAGVDTIEFDVLWLRRRAPAAGAAGAAGRRPRLGGRRAAHAAGADRGARRLPRAAAGPGRDRPRREAARPRGGDGRRRCASAA